MSEWPAGPRFVVRELEGYAARTSRSGVRPGLTVWVGDEAYNGREVKVWRTEDCFRHNRTRLDRRIRGEAAELAERLNAELQ